jgi:hypothetical protein
MAVRIIIDLEDAKGYGNEDERWLDPSNYSTLTGFIQCINEQKKSEVEHLSTIIETDIKNEEVKTVYKFIA